MSNFKLNRFTPLNSVFILLAILSMALFFGGGFISEKAWGINQFSLMPSLFQVIWIAFGLFVAVFFFVAPPRHYIADWLDPYLWGDRKKLGRIIISLIAVAFFAIIRYQAHLYDDSYILIGNLSQKSKTIFFPGTYGIDLIASEMHRLLDLFVNDKIWAALWTYQIISVISAGLFIYIMIAAVEKLFDNRHDRLAFGFLLIFSGITLLFFGFVGRQPILMLLLALFVYNIALLTENSSKKYLLHIWLLAGTGILIHFQFVTVIPALIFLTIVKFAPEQSPRRIPALIGSLVTALIFVAIYYFVIDGNLLMESKTLFLTGKEPTIAYGLFDYRHLFDCMNMRFMAIPLVPIFVASILITLPRFKSDTVYGALAVLATAQTIYMFIMDPTNGMARDFASYIYPNAGLILWGSYALLKVSNREEISRDTVMAFCPAALVVMVPIFAVHLLTGPTEKYLDNYTDNNEYKYESYLLAKRDHFAMVDQMNRALQYEASIKSKAPGALESQLVNDLYASERYQDAFNYAGYLIETFPYRAKYRIQHGILLQHFAKYEEAEKEFRTAIELDPYNPENYHWLSELFRNRNFEHKVRPILKEGLTYDPENTLLLIDLAGNYFRSGKYHLTDSLCQVVHRIDSTNRYPYMYWGLIAEGKNRLTKALDYYNEFIDTEEELPEIPIILKRMNEIVLRQRDGLPRN